MDDELMAEMLFAEIDVDGSGTLDRGEVATMAKKLGTPLSEEALDEAMATMDADGNGSVDFNEFYAWLQQLKASGVGGGDSGWARIAALRAEYYFQSIKGDGSEEAVWEEMTRLERQEEEGEVREKARAEKAALLAAGPGQRLEAKRAQQRTLQPGSSSIGVALRAGRDMDGRPVRRGRGYYGGGCGGDGGAGGLGLPIPHRRSGQALDKPRFGRRSPAPKGKPGQAGSPSRPTNYWYPTQQEGYVDPGSLGRQPVLLRHLARAAASRQEQQLQQLQQRTHRSPPARGMWGGGGAGWVGSGSPPQQAATATATATATAAAAAATGSAQRGPSAEPAMLLAAAMAHSPEDHNIQGGGLPQQLRRSPPSRQPPKQQHQQRSPSRGGLMLPPEASPTKGEWLSGGLSPSF
jgi:hypothetical protein